MAGLSQNPKVSICSITYNHEKFVHEALDGFLQQETDFPFEIVIGDDCSTDNTRAILKGYLERFPNKIRLLLPDKKIGVVPNFAATITACKGKYIALCEGDDYWTNPLKLQKQVDFMESHPECSLCSHQVLHKFENAENRNYVFPNIKEDKIFDRREIYGKYVSATCAVVFRNNHISELIKYLQGFLIGDLPLFYFYLQLGKLSYLAEVMGVYRMHNQGLWFSRNNLEKDIGSFDAYIKIRSKLNIKGAIGIDNAILLYAFRILAAYFQDKNFKGMRIILRRCAEIMLFASKKQRKKYLKYCLLAYFPGLPLLKQFTIDEINSHLRQS